MSILCLHKGDRVLLSVDPPRLKQEVDEIKEELEGRFPGVEFTFICGIDVIAHQGVAGCRGHRD